MVRRIFSSGVGAPVWSGASLRSGAKKFCLTTCNLVFAGLPCTIVYHVNIVPMQLYRAVCIIVLCSSTFPHVHMYICDSGRSDVFKSCSGIVIHDNYQFFCGYIGIMERLESQPQ